VWASGSGTGKQHQMSPAAQTSNSMWVQGVEASESYKWDGWPNKEPDKESGWIFGRA